MALTYCVRFFSTFVYVVFDVIGFKCVCCVDVGENMYDLFEKMCEILEFIGDVDLKDLKGKLV